MFGLLKKILDIFLAYRADEKKGIPPYQDKTIIGLVIGLIAFVLAQYFQIDMPVNLQEGLGAFIVAIMARMAHPKVGVYAKKSVAQPTVEPVEEEQEEAAQPAPLEPVKRKSIFNVNVDHGKA